MIKNTCTKKFYSLRNIKLIFLNEYFTFTIFSIKLLVNNQKHYYSPLPSGKAFGTSITTLIFITYLIAFTILLFLIRCHRDGLTSTLVCSMYSLFSTSSTGVTLTSSSIFSSTIGYNVSSGAGINLSASATSIPI